MYLPEIFRENDENSIAQLVSFFPLAVLIAQTYSGLEAHHIPIFADGKLSAKARLLGHIAKQNDLHEKISQNSPVLAVFSSENGYISPNWYPTKQLHHKHVPTWNYQAVHISGQITFLHDDKSKRAVVGRLTQIFERQLHQDKAWKMADAPADYMAEMLDNIVAFSIEITAIQAKSKLSQNRQKQDFDQVASMLEQQGYEWMPAHMKKRQD